MILTSQELIDLTKKEEYDSLEFSVARRRRGLKRLTVLPLDQLRGLPRQSDEPVVYFLWRGPQLRYIGQSVDVVYRLKQHRRRGKQFTHVTMLSVAPECLCRYERAYVEGFAPPDNLTRRG